MTVGVYPGSFDPFTVGHLDVLTSAAGLFDLVYVAVLHNVDKRPTFTVKERMEMIQNVLATEKLQNVRCGTFDGLLVEYARSVGATHIVRGLRATSDFEYEIQMAQMNARLYTGNTETIFLMTDPRYSFISSSLIKEVVSFGGDVTGLLPEYALQVIRSKMK